MADTGDLVAGGFDKLAQGFTQYQQNKALDQVARGTLDQLLSGGPQQLMQLTPDAQALATKYMQGKASRMDMMQLLGEAQSAIQQRKMQSDLTTAQSQQASNFANASATSAQGNLYNAQAGMANAKLGWLQQMMNQPQVGQPNPGAIAQYAGPAPVQGAQPVGGSGAAAPNLPQGAIMSPPTPIGVTDPEVQALYPQALKMTFGDPDKATSFLQDRVDAINKANQAKYDALATKQQPTGNFYLKRVEYDKNGLPQNNIYSPEIVTGKGTQAMALSAAPNMEVSKPYGSAAPGPVVTMGSDEPDQSVNQAGYNPNAPEWQADVKQAYGNVAASALNLSKAKLLVDAADAYTSGNTGRWNTILGDPKYAGIVQMVKGGNPLNMLQLALASNTQNVLGQIRSETGSVGGRILQNEYENASNVIGKGTMDSATLTAAARNIYSMADRQYSIDKAYATFRETMPAAEAEKRAVNMFAAPPNLVTGQPASPGMKTAPGAPTAQPGGVVLMRLPDGRVGNIPQAQVAQATQMGAVPVN